MLKPRRFAMLTAAFVLVFFTQFQCEDEGCYEEVISNAQVEIQLFPEAKEYSINDTIWITTEIKESDIKGDYRASWLYEGMTIISMQLMKFDSAHEYVIRGSSFFDVVYEHITDPYRPDNTYNVTLDTWYDNGVYRLKVGIVPKIKGHFGIYLSSLNTVYQNDPNCQYNFEILESKIAVNDHNSELYSEHGIDDIVKIGDDNRFEEIDLVNSDRAYTFLVK